MGLQLRKQNFSMYTFNNYVYEIHGDLPLSHFKFTPYMPHKTEKHFQFMSRGEKCSRFIVCLEHVLMHKGFSTPFYFNIGRTFE